MKFKNRIKLISCLSATFSCCTPFCFPIENKTQEILPAQDNAQININSIFSNPTLNPMIGVKATPTDEEIGGYLYKYLSENNKLSYKTVLNELEFNVVALNKTIQISVPNSTRYTGIVSLPYSNLFEPITLQQLFNTFYLTNIYAEPSYQDMRDLVVKYLRSHATYNKYVNIISYLVFKCNYSAKTVQISLADGTQYCGITGTATLNYSVITPTTPITITTHVANNSVLSVATSSDKTSWTSLPRRDDMVSALSSQFPNLKMEAIDFDVNDSICTGGLQYKLTIYKKSGSNYYTGFSSVIFYLKDTRLNIADVFTKTGRSASNPIKMYSCRSQFVNNTIQKNIEIICAANDVDPGTLPLETFSLSYAGNYDPEVEGATFTTTLTVKSNNTSYKPASLTFNCVFERLGWFSARISAITGETINTSQYGWKFDKLIGDESFCLYILNPYKPNEVSLLTSYTKSSDPNALLSIGHHLFVNNKTYEVVGILGCYDVAPSTWGRSSSDVGCFGYGKFAGPSDNACTVSGTVNLPYTLRYMGKNTFRAQAGMTNVTWDYNRNAAFDDPEVEMNFNFYSDSFLDTGIQTLSIPTRVSELPREIIGKQTGSGTINRVNLFNSKFMYSAKKSDNSNVFYQVKINNLWVPQNLYNLYSLDANWVAVCSNGVNSMHAIPHVSTVMKKQIDATGKSIDLNTLKSLWLSQSGIAESKFQEGQYEFVLDKVNKTMTVKTRDNVNFYGSYTVNYIN